MVVGATLPERTACIRRARCYLQPAGLRLSKPARRRLRRVAPCSATGTRAGLQLQ